MRLRVATLNVYYHPANRWREREPLLRRGLDELAPQIVGLQEVDRSIDGDHRLAGDRYAVHRAVAAARDRYPRHWDGVSVLVEHGLGDVVAHDVLALTYHRVVQRLSIRLAAGPTLTVANTHLHHPLDAGGRRIRDRQAAAILPFLDAPAADARILLGDLNGGPGEPFYGRLAGAGYRSAHVEAHGAEPARTFPSGLVSPGGTPVADEVDDYVFVAGAARVQAAGTAWDRPDPADPTLYPSDHLGICADLEVGAP